MNHITPGGHGLGLLKQTPDHRDFLFAPKFTGKLPPMVDLRTSKFRPSIWDQGQLGSCTAHAIGRMGEQTYGIDGFHNQFAPSRLFLYWNSRALEGTTATDAGASMRDAVQALVKQGMCAEHWWPYSTANPGPFSVQPPTEAYQNAAKHLAVQYQAVNQDEVTMKACLAAGFPFVIGIEVHQSFEGPNAAATGVIPLPIVDSPVDPVIGGHALTVEGYDDSHQWWIVDNSWGMFGDRGSVYLPYAYLTNPALSYDFWTLRVQH